MSLESKSNDALAQDRTRLALDRTLMAADRSLMAWVRTALSMISFGFTIYKVLQGFQQSGTAVQFQGNPRTMGLFLTALGTVSMLMGVVEYVHRVQYLRQYHRVRMFQPTFIIALLMALTGLFMFFSIVMKVL